jgi:murein DD-endopeptidase MepM/ murein hydrolase activator NlpD
VVLPRVPALHLAAVALALGLPAAAHATYGWPLQPFDKQHPVRSFFDDPRQEGAEAASFHFGIDISAPDGTPVYAVADGVVRLQPDAVALVADTGDRTFSYWHVDALVADATRVSAGTAIATIKTGFGHVHFAEIHNGHYVNPLRPGGIAPYVDATSPTVVTLFAATGTHKLDLGALSGTLDLLVDAYDTPPTPLPAPPWNLTRVAPAYVRWRLLRSGATNTAWHTAVDFRSYLAPREKFADVYAPWTTLNGPGKPARLIYYLVHGWDSSRAPDGRYRLQVAVFDSQGNSARAGIWVTIANAPSH